MRSLNTGESPVLTCRIPADLHAAVKARAGSRRGDLSLWLRRLLERELDPTAPCNCKTREAVRT